MEEKRRGPLGRRGRFHREESAEEGEGKSIKKAPLRTARYAGAPLLQIVQVLEAMVADWAVFVSESTQSMASMTLRAVRTSASSTTSSR